MDDKLNIIKLGIMGQEIPSGEITECDVLCCGYCGEWHLLLDGPSHLQVKNGGFAYTEKYGWICPECNPVAKHPDLMDSPVPPPIGGLDK